MQYRGFVESVTPFQVRGWVYPVGGEYPCEIEVRLHGTVLVRAKADLFREDLKVSGVGNGEHGFVANLPSSVNGAEIDEIQVVAMAPSEEEWIVSRLPSQPAPSVPSRPQLTSSAKTVDADQFPVFVLGAARSGTSAVAQAFLRSGHFEGAEEGHVFTLLRRLLRTVNDYFEENGDEIAGGRDTLLARIAPDFFRAQMRATFIEAVTRLFPSRHWIDKTPSAQAIEIAPLIRELWPNTKFIFMRRRGIENVSSRMRKFADQGFQRNCTDWARAMETWSRIRPQLHGCAIEIDQMAIARNAGKVAAVLSEFVGLEGDNAARFALALEFDRPERTTERFGRPEDSSYQQWSDIQRSIFSDACSQVMDDYGYTMDETYSRPDMPLVSYA